MFNMDDINEVLNLNENFSYHEMYYNKQSCGLYFVGIKKINDYEETNTIKIIKWQKFLFAIFFWFSFYMSAQSTLPFLASWISWAIFFRIWIALNSLLNCLKISFLISKSLTPLWVKVQSFSKHRTPNLHGTFPRGLNSVISLTCSGEVLIISDNNCLSFLGWWWTHRQLSSVQKEV